MSRGGGDTELIPINLLLSSTSGSNNDSGKVIQSDGDGDENSDSARYPYYLRRKCSSRLSRIQLDRLPVKTTRLIEKNESLNLIRIIPNKWFKYFQDLGNTLINTSWGWLLVLLNLSHILTWVFFACLWYLIAESNGDLDRENPSKTPCLLGVRGFAGYFLFSMETQTTTGYGHRVITHHCPEAVLLLMIQIFFGYGFCAFMTSVVYVKMTAPKRHTKELFSRRAVICQRDGELCLMFRVRDEWCAHQVNTKIKAYLIQRRLEEPILKTLKLEPFGLLLWPLEVVHKITSDSPFWDLSAKDLIIKKFEIIVSMEGTSSISAHSSESTTSYISSEVKWGHRFKPCISYSQKKHCYVVNDDVFNNTEEVLTPLCSSKRMQEVLKDLGGTSTPSSLYSPLFTRTIKYPEWEGIEEEDEFRNFCDESSGIGSIKTDPRSVAIDKINLSDYQNKGNYTIVEVHKSVEENGDDFETKTDEDDHVDNLLKGEIETNQFRRRKDSIKPLFESLDQFVSKDLSRKKSFYETDF